MELAVPWARLSVPGEGHGGIVSNPLLQEILSSNSINHRPRLKMCTVREIKLTEVKL